MIKKNAFFVTAAIALFAFAAFTKPVFADDYDDLDKILNEQDDETLDLENQENKNTSQPFFDPQLQRTLVISAVDSPLDLNPYTSSYTNEAQFINSLQEGLFCYDPKTLDPVPAIASSYRISRDKKRWTFTLRPDAKFSDGTLITADYVIDSWLRLQKTPFAPYASLLDCIKGIKEYRSGLVDEAQVGLKAKGQTLIVTLNTPAAHLPRLLCHHAFCVVNKDENVFSGAYTIESKDDKKLVLLKNKEYWDAGNVALEHIEINFSNDSKENSWFFNTGRTDWVMSAVDTNLLLNRNSIRISAIFGTTYLFFTCRNPIWDNAEFRNALLMAVPWDALRKGNLINATTLVYPLSGYPEVEGLEYYNEDEALEMMEQARKNAEIEQDKKLELTFGITDTDYMKDLAQILHDAWEPLGVELVPFKISDERYHSSIPHLKYDMFSYSWIGDFADPLAFLELFREGSTLNQTNWKNKEFNQTLNLADNETDSKERYELLGKAEQILLDDALILPISHSISLHAINLEQLGGWYTNALDIHPFKSIYFKQAQTEMPVNVAIKK